MSSLPKSRLISHALAMLPLICVTVDAQATNGSSLDPIPYNVIFLVDGSDSMSDCLDGDMVDTNGDGTVDICGSNSKLDAVKAILEEAALTYDHVYFGLAQTDPSGTYSGIGSKPTPINASTRAGMMAPLGSTMVEFMAGLDDLSLNGNDIVTSAESIRDLALYYIRGEFHCNDPVLCADSPINYTCQNNNHIIFITDGTSSTLYPGVDEVPIVDRGCSLRPANDVSATRNSYLDDVANCIANNDQSSDLAGRQTTHTHVVALGTMPYWDDRLFANVAARADSSYAQVQNSGELRGAVFAALNQITDGSYQPMPPSLTVTGEKAFVGWYEVDDARPLHYGKMVGYDIDTDPDSADFGEPILSSLWRAHELLENRSVSVAELQETTNGNNGDGIRDIYTNIDKDAVPDAFDASNLGDLCLLLLADTVAGQVEGNDVNGDGFIDTLDCQEVIDFVRGLDVGEFLSTGTTRGASKLGGVRHGQIAVAEPNPAVFTRNPTFRKFIEDLPDDLTICPPGLHGVGSCDAHVAYVTASDGMLHAFQANTGRELWSYIPRNLLGQTVSNTVEEGVLFDLMWAERRLLDATPEISYVWIDGYEGQGSITTGDGVQQSSEWVRVLTVGQGEGGRYYLALDITQPDKPYILWEDTTNSGASGMGATLSTPKVSLVRSNTKDDWVAFYGSGSRMRDEDLSARLYIRAMGDMQGMSESYDDAGIAVSVDLDGDGNHDGIGFPSEPTVIDRDNDGDADEVFMVSESGVIYKFVIDESNIDASTACLFFDPENAILDTGGTATVAPRTDGYYSATAAVNSVGEVLIYYGTGSPMNDFTTDRGYFFAIKDTAGCNQGQLFTKCDGNGTIGLAIGEEFTGSPVVYDGTVYFSTYTPASNRCLEGEGRLYAFDYQFCTASLDTNNSGTVGDGDALYMSLGSGMPSEVVIANDRVYVATSSPNSTPDVTVVDVPKDLTTGTTNIQWREIF